MKKILCLLLLTAMVLPAAAAEVDCDAMYCFGTADFSTSEDPLRGVCITGLPEPEAGTVMLGSRVVRTGDILAASHRKLDDETDLGIFVAFMLLPGFFPYGGEGVTGKQCLLRGKDLKAVDIRFCLSLGSELCDLFSGFCAIFRGDIDAHYVGRDLRNEHRLRGNCC